MFCAVKFYWYYSLFSLLVWAAAVEVRVMMWPHVAPDALRERLLTSHSLASSETWLMDKLLLPEGFQHLMFYDAMQVTIIICNNENLKNALEFNLIPSVKYRWVSRQHFVGRRMPRPIILNSNSNHHLSNFHSAVTELKYIICVVVVSKMCLGSDECYDTDTWWHLVMWCYFLSWSGESEGSNYKVRVTSVPRAGTGITMIGH